MTAVKQAPPLPAKRTHKERRRSAPIARLRQCQGCWEVRKREALMRCSCGVFLICVSCGDCRHNINKCESDSGAEDGEAGNSQHDREKKTDQ